MVNYGLLIVGILCFLPLTLFLLGVETESVIAPCVDGDGDMNLEDIMCDKEVAYLYGSNIDSSEISFFLLPIFLLTIAGFFMVLGSFIKF